MKSITTKIEFIDNKYYLEIPEAIVEMMEWSQGDTVFVPFHEITKKQSIEESAEEEVEGNLRGKHFKIRREGVIEKLENPTEKMYIFRTAYIEWNGEKFGSKNILREFVESRDFTTAEAEFYLKKLGFKPKRIYDSR